MKGRFFVLRGLALKPALYDWGSEKLFGNECVSRFSRMEPVIQIGDVYGREPFKEIKIGNAQHRFHSISSTSPYAPGFLPGAGPS